CKPRMMTLNDFLPQRRSFYIVLEGVEKPGNLGAVIRSADGAGAEAVIMTNAKTDIYNHNVVRSSIGTIFMCPVLEASQLDIQAFFTRYDIATYVATSRAKQLYTECDFTQRSAIIIGNEHSGVSAFWQEQGAREILIPMLGEGRCLNAAMSSSIIMYEICRQQGIVNQRKERNAEKKSISG
ncbi:MAG: RNA methyltransferase, partial [Candidatus Omnitrophica bacterium]|nr:RNA methyltransferase [Candidatus Omnitrophota bacterium]